jgi:hypothetical protein
MPVLPRYQQFGGVHPETAAFTNMLAAHGVTAPHTGEPFSEAMIFGLSGGPGVGYILWEFQEHGMKVIVLAFQHLWQYPADYFQRLAQRMGVAVTVRETGSRKVAAKNLEDTVARGHPALAWVDRATLPYLQLPPEMIGHIGHFVVACGAEDGHVLLDDRAHQPFSVPAETFADARARIGSYKNRLLIIEEADPGIDLRGAIRQGLEACVEHLNSSSQSFSLPALQKWAKLMTDPKNKKGWPVVFADRRGLYSALSSIFEAIALHDAPGGLRALYADFLTEAAPLVGGSGLEAVAAQYRDLGNLWDDFAEAALPGSVAPFREAKQRLRERNEVLARGGDAWRATGDLTARIGAIRSACNLDFPLNDAEVTDLFADLQARLRAIHASERKAIESLANVIA